VRILLRHLASSSEDGTRTEYVDLPGIPSKGDEIHWADRVIHVHKVVWFPGPNDNGPVACLFVEEF
jgi:hypothetical protein